MITCCDCDVNFLQRKAELVKFDAEKHICTDCKNIREDKNRAKYWSGSQNKLIRYWFYIKQGIAVLNEVRNLFFIVLGTCFTFKDQFPILKNLAVVGGIFIVAFIVLFLLGYLFTHKVNKVIDWLNIEFATHFAKYQFTLLERQVKALEELNAKSLGTIPGEKIV